MSRFEYNLNRLSQEDQQARYDVISKFTQLDPYFAYLPYITNPTNNYLKYSNKDLNTILINISYGTIQAQENQEFKRLYTQFVREYQLNMEIYIREEQEKLIRLQQQQLAALQYNTNNTEPVAFNAGEQYNQYSAQQYPPQRQHQQYGQPQQQQYSQQQQQYNQQQYSQQQYGQQYGQQYSQQQQYGQQQQFGQQQEGFRRDYRNNNRQGGQYNREQGQYNNREPGQYNNRQQGQHNYRQPRQHHQHQEGEQGQHQNYKRRQFHQKRHQNYQHQQHYQHQQQQSQLTQAQTILYHKLAASQQQGYIQATTESEYHDLTSFIQKYNITIQIKYSPVAATELLEEDKPQPKPEPIPEPKPAVVPKPIPEPIPEPKPEPKPKKFSIEEIKQFINSVTKEQLQKHVNPEVVQMANKINSWPVSEVEVEQKEDKMYRKDSKKPNDKGNYNKNSNYNNNYIKTGVKKDEAQIAESLGYKPKEATGVQITIGKNETLETRKLKEEIKSMAGKDFNTLKASEFDGLSHVEKCKKEIVFNLNLIVPQNLALVEEDLIKYLFEDIEVCKVLIEEIIKKAWDQPKYASTYAKLCSDFSKHESGKFKFQGAKKEKEGKEGKEGKQGKEGKKDKDNPFKYFLIDRVQHSFDEKIDKFPEFETPEDKEAFLKDKKKHILSNVKFIAELIIHKILHRKRTMKYCISQMFYSFFKHYHAYLQHSKVEDSIYDYYFEAIIEFIENIGSIYEELCEKEKEGKEGKLPQFDYEAVRNHMGEIFTGNSAPKFDILPSIEGFNGDQYFKILDFVNSTHIQKKFPRLGALLQNLKERRGNKWQKHLSVAEGPKKLKEIQEDILKEEDDLQGKGKDKISKQKMESQKLDKKVKELFEGWEMGKNEELREIRDIVKKSGEKAFYFSFLKQVADQKKDNIIKRIALFPVLLNEKFNYNEFKKAWFDIIKYLAIGSGDYPFCGAALAQVLQALFDKEGHIEEFHRKYDQDQEEDELFFLEEILQKYYHYSKDESVLKFVKPKAKLSGLI